VRQAELRPNPRLSIQTENWTFSGPPQQSIASTFTDHFLYASQLVETAGKRRRRVDLALAGLETVREDRRISQRDIAMRVRLAYWAAVGAVRAVQLLEENQRTLQGAVEYHQIQVDEGAIPEADLIRMRLEADRAEVALEAARRNEQAARITLFREMGEQEFPEVQLVELPNETSPPAEVDIDTVLAARPDMRRALQAVEQAQANLRLQQAGARPDVEVLGGYKRTAGYNTVMGGVQISLPLSNRNQGNIAAAVSEVHAAQADEALLEARIRAEVEAARRDVRLRHERLAELMTEALGRADEVVEIARAAYREGGSDLLRLLDAERAHIELEVMNARLLTEYRQSAVVLETALGGKL
jgi:cobalt-zinc-cadmium efflux system outer membrane protein